MLDLVTSTQAAKMLDVTRRTVARMVQDGRLVPAMTTPGGPHGAFMFNRAEIEREVRRGRPKDDEGAAA